MYGGTARSDGQGWDQPSYQPLQDSTGMVWSGHFLSLDNVESPPIIQSHENLLDNLRLVPGDSVNFASGLHPSLPSARRDQRSNARPHLAPLGMSVSPFGLQMHDPSGSAYETPQSAHVGDPFPVHALFPPLDLAEPLCRSDTLLNLLKNEVSTLIAETQIARSTVPGYLTSDTSEELLVVGLETIRRWHDIQASFQPPPSPYAAFAILLVANCVLRACSHGTISVANQESFYRDARQLIAKFSWTTEVQSTIKEVDMLWCPGSMDPLERGATIELGFSDPFQGFTGGIYQYLFQVVRQIPRNHHGCCCSAHADIADTILPVDSWNSYKRWIKTIVSIMRWVEDPVNLSGGSVGHDASSTGPMLIVDEFREQVRQASSLESSRNTDSDIHEFDVDGYDPTLSNGDGDYGRREHLELGSPQRYIGEMPFHPPPTSPNAIAARSPLVSAALTGSTSPASVKGQMLCCSLCNSRFSGEYRSGNLQRHKRTKHAEQRFLCPRAGCLRTFARKDARLKHERRKHPELDRPPAVSRR